MGFFSKKFDEVKLHIVCDREEKAIREFLRKKGIKNSTIYWGMSTSKIVIDPDEAKRQLALVDSSQLDITNGKSLIAAAEGAKIEWKVFASMDEFEQIVNDFTKEN